MKFVKQNPDDKVLWADEESTIGDFTFSFDGKKAYNLFSDYPYKLTAEEKKIFDAENPFWAEFFKDRNGNKNNE